MRRAIIACVEIPHFDAICTVLGKDAFVYINKIAKVVHDTAMTWGGAPFANRGGVFYLAWMLDDAWERIATDDKVLAAITNVSSEPAKPARHSKPSAPGHATTSTSGLSSELADPVAMLLFESQAHRRPHSIGPSSSDGGRSRLSLALHRVAGLAIPKHSASANDTQLVQVVVEDAELSRARHALAEQIVLDCTSLLAEKALYGCMKIIARLRRSEDILGSREASILRTSKELYGFRPSVKIGLHIGDFVESAVGSSHKMEPCLFSPEMQIAKMLLAATHLYGESILLSGDFHGLLGTSVTTYGRLIDVVGVPRPIQTLNWGLPLIESARPVSMFAVECWDWAATLLPSLVTTLFPKQETRISRGNGTRHSSGHVSRAQSASPAVQNSPLLSFDVLIRENLLDADRFVRTSHALVICLDFMRGASFVFLNFVFFCRCRIR
jgi:hypothetical protein